MSEDFSGFDGYEPVSVDPGSLVLILTVLFCTLSLAIIPCFMSLHNQYGCRQAENDEYCRGNERSLAANENGLQERVRSCV